MALSKGKRTRRSARGNRWGLAVLGLVLLVAGVLSLAAGLGAFGIEVAGSPLVGEATADWLGQPWVPYAGAAVAVIVALVALRWLVAQARSDTVGRLRMEEETAQGATEIPAAAARSVLEDQIEEYPQVRRVRAHLTGTRREPGILLDLTLDADADVASVWQRIRREEVANLCDALELDDLPAVVRMSMAAPPRSRPRELR